MRTRATRKLDARHKMSGFRCLSRRVFDPREPASIKKGGRAIALESCQPIWAAFTRQRLRRLKHTATLMRRLWLRMRPLSSRGTPLLRGRCACGGVTIDVKSVTPSHAPAYCHCNTCRAMHGAAFALEAGFRTADVVVTGATASYRSSRHYERRRCATCGAPVGGVHHKLGAVFVPTALFAAPGAPPPEPLAPTMHLFYGRRIVGDAFDGDGLPKYEGFPPSD